MPLYEFRCQACGKEIEVLQKISEAPRTICPACGAAALVKKVSAAGFQLKGTGWYATDFKGGNRAPASGNSDATPATSPPAAPASETAPAATPAPAAATPSTPS